MSDLFRRGVSRRGSENISGTGPLWRDPLRRDPPAIPSGGTPSEPPGGPPRRPPLEGSPAGAPRGSGALRLLARLSRCWIPLPKYSSSAGLGSSSDTGGKGHCRAVWSDYPDFFSSQQSAACSPKQTREGEGEGRDLGHPVLRRGFCCPLFRLGIRLMLIFAVGAAGREATLQTPGLC